MAEESKTGARQLMTRCECGWESRGTEDEVVAATMAHARDAHNMESTREQVLSRAQEV